MVIRIMMKILLIALSAFRATASDVVYLDDHVESIRLESHVGILRDPTGSLTFEEVRGGGFVRNREDVIDCGFTDDVVWLRVKLASGSKKPADWLMELGFPRLMIVDWFVVRNGRLAAHHKAGNARPMPILRPESRKPPLPVYLAPAEQVEIYLRLQSETRCVAPLSIYSPIAYSRHLAFETAFYCLFFSVLAALCVLGALFALFIRYRGGLLYACWVASALLLFLGLSGYWSIIGLPGNAWAHVRGPVIFNDVSAMLLLLFIRSAFRTPEIMPRMDAVIMWMTAACLALLVCTPFIPFKAAVLGALAINAASIVVAAAVSFISLGTGSPHGKVFALAWIFFCIVVAASLLVICRLLPPIFPPVKLHLIGTTMLAFLLFGFQGVEARRLRLENESALQSKLELQSRMNDELERQVAQRTESLKQALDQAQRASHYKGLFLANMSHEIRVPLSALVGLAQAMCRKSAEKQLPDDLVRMLGKVRAGGAYLGVMLNNLLDVSAAETGKTPVRPEEFDPGSWARDLRDILEPIADTKGVTLKWNDAALDGEPIRSDRSRLSQILLNLAHNALKFTPAGKSVEVTFRQDGGRFAFEVADEGPGLPEDSAPLFGAFEQSSGIISDTEHGVGLGLHVVKTNTRLLNASMTIERNPAGGARFRIELPPHIPQAHHEGDHC